MVMSRYPIWDILYENQYIWERTGYVTWIYDEDKSYELTGRSNMCLVVTDGTAVLGLGDIGVLRI